MTPYSPDTLKSFLESYAMAEVFCQEPITIEKLKEIIEELACESTGEAIGGAASWQISEAVVRLAWRLAAGLSNISFIE